MFGLTKVKADSQKPHTPYSVYMSLKIFAHAQKGGFACAFTESKLCFIDFLTLAKSYF
jgi:hypothetical protein